MISLKQQINEAYNKTSAYRKLSEQELAALKRCILDIYVHLNTLCEEHNLDLMLAGGSCLGAIRHKGFIPWDDDLDLMMSRKDYNKLLQLCEEGALGDKYEFSYPSKSHDAPCAFLKIYRKDSKIVGLDGENEKYPSGIFVDIFPIEGTPKSILKRKIKGFIANTLRLCANMVDVPGKWSSNMSEFYKQNGLLFVNMKIRLFWGKILSVISHKKWICWYDAYIKDEEIGEYAIIPAGRKLYEGELLLSNVYFPPSKGEFEGMVVKLPADPDAYLKNLYGNYMWIPPVEKRESHMIVDIKLPEKYYKK